MTKSYTKTFASIEEIRDANQRAGFYFFEPDTMRFFAGRVREQGIIGGRFFVHSTKACFRDYRRRYHVGVVADTGDIENIGPRDGFDTAARARRWARALAKLPFVPMSEFGLPIHTDTEADAWTAWQRAHDGTLASS